MTEPIPPSDEFRGLCDEHGIALDAGDAERLGAYLALLLDANERMNLTAIRDAGGAWVRHIFDSLTLLPVLPEAGGHARLIDVGSGGGVPGVVLAIAQPELEVTCLEATGKKAAFLRGVGRELGLENLRVVQARAEAAGRDPAHRERYDAATARALGRLTVAAELVTPLLKVGGLGLFIKGEKADEELVEARAALHLLHVVHAGTVQTPTGRIVIIERRRATPRAYPRGDGVPKKSPLGL